MRYEVFQLEQINTNEYGCGRSIGVFEYANEGDAIRHFKEMYCGGNIPLMLDTHDKAVAFWLPNKGYAKPI